MLRRYTAARRREREIKKMKNNGETYLTPLTKEMKSSINIEIDKRVNELNTCDNTPYVALYKSVYGIAKSFINALPDGYPVPVTKE